jgi:hypothetical protein
MKIPPMPFTVTNWSSVTPTRASRRDRTSHLAHLHHRRFAGDQVEYTTATAGIIGTIYNMSFKFSKANSIPNFTKGENSSYCQE